MRIEEFNEKFIKQKIYIFFKKKISWINSKNIY